MENLILIAAFVLALAAWWVYLPARAVLHDRKLGTLAQTDCQAPDLWPSVSVLVPARNEESTLAAAMQSLRRVDYPELEIILVNDRSSDRTGEIVDRLAAEDARIRPLHIETLPAGWLGRSGGSAPIHPRRGRCVGQPADPSRRSTPPTATSRCSRRSTVTR